MSTTEEEEIELIDLTEKEAKILLSLLDAQNTIKYDRNYSAYVSKATGFGESFVQRRLKVFRKYDVVSGSKLSPYGRDIALLIKRHGFKWYEEQGDRVPRDQIDKNF